MQGIGGEQHAVHAECVDQDLDGGNLVSRRRDFLVRQDEGGVGGEGTEHVRSSTVVQVIETAAQRLPVE
jgi:hypothetical protein